MKLAIDATFNPHGGALIHLKEFIVNLKNLVGIENILIFIKEENIDLIGLEILKDCELEIIKIPSNNKLLWVLWMQCILPFKLRIWNSDILFSPGNISPILRTTKIKSQWIATIGPFDQAVYNGLSAKERLALLVNKFLMLFSMKTSNVVVHESDYSQSLLTCKYSLDPKKQFLIECGKSEFFYPNINQEYVSNRNIRGINSNDLLCVSHFYPYKNMERMILAFFKFLENNKDTETRLFICGLPIFSAYYHTILKLVKRSHYSQNVIIVGGVNQADLRYAYSKCRLMIFPSLCESSGYALIEAMSCGTPILTTQLTAIPFTCQNAAIYFDAFDVNDLSKKLHLLYNDDDALLELREKSFQRSGSMLNYKEAAQAYYKILLSDINNL